MADRFPRRSSNWCAPLTTFFVKSVQGKTMIDLTPLPNEESRQREVVLKTTLLLAAIAINTIEFFIPRIPLFPWMKPGLANAITIVWIIRWGFTDALLASLLRIWIVSFFFGFSFLTLLLSASGALFACAAMGMTWYLAGRTKIIGIVGLAVIGALFHNIGQLLSVYILMDSNEHLFYQLPIMTLAAVIFGMIVGIVTPAMLSASQDGLEKIPMGVKVHKELPPSRGIHVAISLAFLLFCMVLAGVNDTKVLIASAFGVTVLVQILERGSWQALVAPMQRFWMFFLFIALVDLFFTYGTRMPGLGTVTQEGIDSTLIQWLRLWTWLQTASIFKYFHFHVAVFKGLRRMFANRRETLYAGLLAIEYFPAVFENVRAKGRMLLSRCIRHPASLVRELYGYTMDIVVGK
jgi:heptaprenyl diphosphate synthase